MLALALVSLAEVGSRCLLARVGRQWEYWSADAAIQFEEYRRQTDNGQNPEVLIVGDSTGGYDIDPAVISECAPEQPRVYNLAAPANYPFAFRDTTLSLLRSLHTVPHLVIASFSLDGFVDAGLVRKREEQILASAYCRHSSGRFVAADYISLLRLLQASPFIKNAYWVKRDLQHASTSGKASSTNDTYTEGGGQIGGGLDDALTHSKRFSSERFNVVRELADLAQARGFRLLIVVPPRWKDSMSDVYAEYVRELRQAKEDYGFTILDAYHTALLSEVHFADKVHLNQDGATAFSRELARTVIPVLLSRSRTPVDVEQQAQLP